VSPHHTNTTNPFILAKEKEKARLKMAKLMDTKGGLEHPIEHKSRATLLVMNTPAG
jgi:hypothetical protein